MSSALHQLYESSLWSLGHTWGNDTSLLNQNKLRGDWTGALCVHVLHLHPLGSVCACVSAASKQLVLVQSTRDLGYFLSRGGQQEEQTYLPPPVGLPTGASPHTTGLLRPRPRQMTAVFLLYFGLVLINTGYLPLLGPPATTHWALRRERGQKWGWVLGGEREK